MTRDSEQRITKSEHAQRTDRNLASLKGTDGLNPLEKLALAARILAAEGHSGGLAGQITTREKSTGHFVTLALGIGFEEARATDLIRIDDNLNVVDGNGVPNPATRFHLWIYRHRPHVQAIIHTQPPAVSASSMLGDKRSILLANHGLITTGTSIEEATYLAVYLEPAAALQLAASAAGKIRPVDPDKAREAGVFLLKAPIVNATFAYLARRALRDRAVATPG